jgi:hypothetical protein
MAPAPGCARWFRTEPPVRDTGVTLGALDFVRGLEAQDGELEATAAQLAEALDEAEAVGAEAAELAALLARVPDDRRRGDDAAEAARADLERRRTALEQAERQAGAVPGARTGVELAEERLARAERERQLVEERAAAAQAGAASLAERAHRAASLLASSPALAPRDVSVDDTSLDRLTEWSSRARAAAFVAKGRIDREREGLIRQANEAAASALGESFGGASLAVVRRRLESGR